MAKAKALSVWKSNIKTAWPELAIKDVRFLVNNGEGSTRLNPKHSCLKVGSQLSVTALVELGGIAPDDISVELYHGPVDSWGNISNGSAVKMDYKEASGRNGEHCFTGTMACKTSGRQGLAVRILPRNADLPNPYEMGLVLWETTTEKSNT